MNAPHDRPPKLSACDAAAPRPRCEADQAALVNAGAQEAADKAARDAGDLDRTEHLKAAILDQVQARGDAMGVRRRRTDDDSLDAQKLDDADARLEAAAGLAAGAQPAVGTPSRGTTRNGPSSAAPATAGSNAEAPSAALSHEEAGKVAVAPLVPGIVDAAAKLPSLTERARPPAPATDPRVPYWIPGGVDYDTWPGDLKLAVANVINPCYEELVLRARPGLARSMGLTIVHLMWLEMLDHIKLARLGHECDVRDPDDPLDLVNVAVGMLRDPNSDRTRLIARNLQVVASKLKACVILASLDEFKVRASHASWIPCALPGEGGLPAESGITTFYPSA